MEFGGQSRTEGERDKQSMWPEARSKPLVHGLTTQGVGCLGKGISDVQFEVLCFLII